MALPARPRRLRTHASGHRDRRSRGNNPGLHRAGLAADLRGRFSGGAHEPSGARHRPHAGVAGAAPETEASAGKLRVLRLRGRLINRALGLCTYSALLVAAVIAAIFVGAVARIDFSIAIAIAFVVAMTTFIAGLICSLREVHLATRYMREATGR